MSREVIIFSNSYDYVITTGGIGPTHDDITYEGKIIAWVKATEMENTSSMPKENYFQL